MPFTRTWAARMAACGLAAVTALALPGTALAARPVPAGSTGVAPKALALLAQSPWVMPATPGTAATFDLTIGLPPGERASSARSIKVMLYQRLTSRSVFEQDVSNLPAGVTVDRTHPVPLSCLTPASPGYTLKVVVTPTATALSPGRAVGTCDGATSATPTLNLSCNLQAGSCAGVYPLSVDVEDTATGAVVERVTTFLTYVQAASPVPLRFSWIVPFHAPTTVDAGAPRAPGVLVAPPAATTASLVTFAGQLAGAGSVPVTVAADPRTIQALQTQAGAAGRHAVAQLAGLAAAGTDEFPAQPYVPVNTAVMAGAGLTGEVKLQVARGRQVLTAAGIHTTTGTLLVDGPTGPNLVSSLPLTGATRVVLPGADVAPTTDAFTFSQPFRLAPPGRGRLDAPGAVTDPGLDATFTADRADPALAAVDLLADLAFVYFERPNLRLARGVIAEPPEDWTPDPSFVHTLLAGLAANPVVDPVTAATFFSLPSGVNGAANTRRLATTGTAASLPRAVAQETAQARRNLTAFDSAVQGTPPLLLQLYDVVLAGESPDLGSGGEERVFAAFERLLRAQLSKVQLATDRTITFTARTASIPVTVLSSAPYAVSAVVTLTSGRFIFPHGSSATVLVSRPTNPVRIEAEARTSGDAPVEVTLHTPRGNLVIARGELTVRSTATSLVAIVLTLLSALVLGAWWARTWRQGRRRRADAERD